MSMSFTINTEKLKDLKKTSQEENCELKRYDLHSYYCSNHSKSFFNQYRNKFCQIHYAYL